MIVQYLDFPWEAFIVLIPLSAGVFCFLFSKYSGQISILSAILILLSVIGLGIEVTQNGSSSHQIGGWGAPLGIDYYIDGLTVIMLSMTAIVAIGINIYAFSYFSKEKENPFWSLFSFLIGSLNALFLSNDIFNYYVTLELIGISAVAMTALGNTSKALSGAIRYLIVTLLGSLLYLFGVGLLYHTYGTVDITLLSKLVELNPTTTVVAILMSFGLMFKTALFPFHFWLPSAHSNAPAPVSAILSALVVKASFYILIRLWLKVFPVLDNSIIETLFAILGIFAVLWGSSLALKQTKLKLLIAYSTVAQIGYLFIAFSLALQSDSSAWKAVVILAISHAMAKSAMFMVAGNLIHFAKHDNFKDIDRVVEKLPITVMAFTIAGINIIGLPPTGGFIGKWYLLESAINQNMWLIVITIVIGTFLSTLYIFKVLGHAFVPSALEHKVNSFGFSMQWSALLLGVFSLLVGLFAMYLFEILAIGLPFDPSKVI